MASAWDEYTLYGAPYSTGYEPGLYSLGGPDPYLDVPDPVGSWEPSGQSAAPAGYDWEGLGKRGAKAFGGSSFASDAEDQGPGFPRVPQIQGPVRGRQAGMDQLMAGLTGSRNPWVAYRPYYAQQSPDQQQILRILGLVR